MRTIPSPPQAKYLAHLLAGNFCNIGGYNTPTHNVLKKRGWIIPTGVTGNYVNGNTYAVHIISDAGMDALEEFLREARVRRSLARDDKGGR